MQLQTILNRVQRHRGFVYKKAKLVDKRDGPVVEVDIEPRSNSRAICSGCGRPGPGYDREPTPRSFQFVPLWGMAVVFLYAMRRVDCRHCGVKVERVPWAEGKHQLTTTYQVFLASWAKLLSWKQVARAFRTSWENVFRSVKTVVAWGLAHRSLEGIEAIGVDEVQWQKGHKYLTLVYQIDQGCRRLLWIGKDRTAKTFLGFFRMLGRQRSAGIRFVCSDMWKAYLKVTKKKAANALHVLDRFHIMAMMAVIVDLANRDLTGEKYCSSVHFVDRAVRAAPERAWLASLRCLCHRTSYRDTSHDSCSIYSTHGPPPRLLPLDTHRNHPGMPRFPPPRPAVPLPTPVRP